MRLVPINCIKEGSYLAKSIYDLDGRVLLAKGVKLTSKIIEKAEIIGIMSLYVNDEYSSNEIEDIIKPELRQKAIKAIVDSFKDSMKFRKYPVDNKYKQHSNYKNSKVRHQHTENLSNVINEIIDEMLFKKSILINLVDIKSMDNYTYEHSVNVIILSLVLGIGLSMSRDKLYNLAMGAMMHDIGKIFIPKEVLQKNGRLTESEFNLIKEHPTKGYEYLKENIDISAMSSIIALQHHEKIDGTGYPDGIMGDKIHQYARIASIADVYDALTSDRPYRRAMCPNEALEYLMGSADRQFDFNMVSIFVKSVVPYPVGTLVKLSNGCIAVVEEGTLNFPMRPKVRVICSNSDENKMVCLNLMEEKNIVIEGIQYEAPQSSS